MVLDQTKCISEVVNIVRCRRFIQQVAKDCKKEKQPKVLLEVGHLVDGGEGKI